VEAEVIEAMYRCEICGEETQRPVKWFVIQCGDSQLKIVRWSKEAADAPGARHYCGEAHAQVYISRWFQTYCG
jgi:hypothetical protein